MEDDFMELLPSAENDFSLREEVCVKRSKLCKKIESRREEL
jgi:hypothetical protein